jgi:hypothetical protein
MIKRWLCLLLVSAFMLQSVVAGVGMHDSGQPAADHQTASLVSGHAPDDANHAKQDCDMHQHGHCCQGHFSAVLNSHTFDFLSANNLFTENYAFFIPSPPSSELLRPPAV